MLASAIEKGVDPDSTYYTSAPFTCSIGPWCQTPWQVHTYENSYSGSESLTRATLQSDNTVYAQLTLDVGPRYVWQMAHRLGVHLSPDKPVASIGLGSLAVSPLDMAAAYATFPAMGIYAKPMAITKVILPGGHVDKDSGWGKPQTKRALSEGVAWKVTDVLRQNALYGTGAGSGDGIHVNAGKTGTTDNHADAWFDGYTQQLGDRRLDGLPEGRDPDARTCTAWRSPAPPSRCRSGTSTWRPRSGIARCSASSCRTSTRRGERSPAGITEASAPTTPRRRTRPPRRRPRRPSTRRRTRPRPLRA